MHVSILVLLFVNLLVAVKAVNYQLKLVQLLIRHGDRSPIKTFPTSLWKNAWPEGFGQLTTLGMKQQYETGQYLRKHYGFFINYAYNYKTLFVQSTNADRTLMSAYTCLAGLLPPVGRQIWNNELLWQPIPVHTLPVPEDYLLSPSSKCPKYDQLLSEQMKSSEVEQVNLQYKEFYRFLTNKTGLSINDFSQASDIYGILSSDQIHNHSLPKWVNNTVYGILRKFQYMYFEFVAKTDEMARLRGGPLIGEMIKNIETNIRNNTDQPDIFMYSSHDETVTSVLSALDLFDPQIPTFGCMIMLELLEANRTHFVKILYRNDLTLHGCSNPCPVAEFKKITASVIPADIKAECSL